MAINDRQLIPASATRDSAERRGYLAIGVVAVIAFIAAYVLIGTPGLHTQVAHAPIEVASDR